MQRKQLTFRLFVYVIVSLKEFNKVFQQVVLKLFRPSTTSNLQSYITALYTGKYCGLNMYKCQ